MDYIVTSPFQFAPVSQSFINSLALSIASDLRVIGTSSNSTGLTLTTNRSITEAELIAANALFPSGIISIQPVLT